VDRAILSLMRRSFLNQTTPVHEDNADETVMFMLLMTSKSSTFMNHGTTRNDHYSCFTNKERLYGNLYVRIKEYKCINIISSIYGVNAYGYTIISIDIWILKEPAAVCAVYNK
jgi:hypothetical protein